MFLIIAAVINMGACWFSDRIALRTSRRQAGHRGGGAAASTRWSASSHPRRPADAEPHVIPQEQPNAFATGRNPKNAAVAVTARHHEAASPRTSCAACIAHELAHIRNRDILIAVRRGDDRRRDHLSRLHAAWFGGDDDSPLGLVGALAMVILAPIAASLIQLAISRQREYSADATGAEICGNPESLASALLRLEEGAKAIPMQVNQASEPLYIVKPFSGGGIATLFSTHPPIEERVRRLRQMRPSLG